VPKFSNAPALERFLAPDRNSFGVVRLAMAVLVLVSHSYWFVTGVSRNEPLERWTGHSLSEHAVQVFFFLSGILIAQSFAARPDLATFIAARTLRIFPALIVCVVLSAFLLGPLVTKLDLIGYFTDRKLPAYIIATTTLATGSAPLPGVFTTLPLPNLVNMSLWTLKFEMICYVGVALLGLAGLFNERFRFAIMGAFAVGLALVFLKSPFTTQDYTTVDNLRYFALYFGMGTLAFLARRELPVMPVLALPLFALLVAAIGTRGQELACAIFLGYGTLVVATRDFGEATRFCRVHDYSYGVYIYAAPLQMTLIQLFPKIHPVALSCWALAAALPLAAMSWQLVEKPALALRSEFADWLGRWLPGRPVVEVDEKTDVEDKNPGSVDERQWMGASNRRRATPAPRPARLRIDEAVAEAVSTPRQARQRAPRSLLDRLRGTPEGPSAEEIAADVARCADTDRFRARYAAISPSASSRSRSPSGMISVRAEFAR
jgi:peptidoglycan/LPS O-acetylase OafA/YrhL